MESPQYVADHTRWISAHRALAHGPCKRARQPAAAIVLELCERSLALLQLPLLQGDGRGRFVCALSCTLAYLGAGVRADGRHRGQKRGARCGLQLKAYDRLERIPLAWHPDSNSEAGRREAGWLTENADGTPPGHLG